MEIKDIFNALQPILAKIEEENSENASYIAKKFSESENNEIMDGLFKYFRFYTMAYHIWDTSYEYDLIKSHIYTALGELTNLRSNHARDVPAPIIDVFEANAKQLMYCFDLDHSLVLGDYHGMVENSEKIIQLTQAFLDNAEYSEVPELAVFIDDHLKINMIYAQGSKLFAELLILKDRNPLKFLEVAPERLALLKSITDDLKDLECYTDYSEIYAHYYVLKKHYEVERSIEEHLIIKNADIILNKSFYFGPKWGQELLNNFAAFQESIMDVLSNVDFVEKTILPDIFLSNQGQKYLESILIGFTRVQIHSPFGVFTGNLELFLNYYGSGYFRLQLPVENMIIDQIRGLLNIPSPFSGSYDFTIGRKTYSSFTELTNAIFTDLQKTCASCVEGKRVLNKWSMSDDIAWFSYIEIKELIAVPKINIPKLMQSTDGTNDEKSGLTTGEYRIVESHYELVDHPFMKGLMLPPRESTPSSYDWINAKVEPVKNLAHIKTYPENTFIVSKHHAVLHFPGVPNYIINEIRKSLEYAFNISTILFELNKIITSEKEELKEFSDRIVDKLQQEDNKDLDEIVSDMERKSIEINEFSNITLIASEALKSVNMTKYEDHAKIMDEILREMKAFDVMRDIQDTHNQILSNHGNLLELTQGIIERYESKKEEFRGKLLEVLNTIMSIIAITAAIDYIAPVLNWDDPMKLIILIIFVLLFVLLSQTYYFMKRRKLSYW